MLACNNFRIIEQIFKFGAGKVYWNLHSQSSIEIETNNLRWKKETWSRDRKYFLLVCCINKLIVSNTVSLFIHLLDISTFWFWKCKKDLNISLLLFVRNTKHQSDFLLLWPLRIYELNLWCRVLLEKLTVVQLIRKCTRFNGTRIVVSVFSRIFLEALILQ